MLSDKILLRQNLLKGPEVETADLSQIAVAIEELASVLTRNSHVLRHATKQLHHLGQMIIILVVGLRLAWLE